MAHTNKVLATPIIICTQIRLQDGRSRLYYGNLPLAPSLGVVTAEEGVETEDVLALRLLLSTRLSRLTEHP